MGDIGKIWGIAVVAAAAVVLGGTVCGLVALARQIIRGREFSSSITEHSSKHSAAATGTNRCDTEEKVA